MDVTAGRLILVSNRLPVTVKHERGEISVARSAGGLVTGLRGPHEQSGGVRVCHQRAGHPERAVGVARDDERLRGTDRLRVAGDLLQALRRDEFGVGARIARQHEIKRRATVLDEPHQRQLGHTS